MNSNNQAAGQLLCERFPRASRYHPEWVLAGAGGGANALWLTEWLCEALAIRPGMRVLDLGCGRAISSIFLHREFGAQVWAVDLWNGASENHQRIRDAGAADGVFPLHADARELPFAAEFFDAIVSMDSFFYYGTDDLFLSNIARLLKPGGALGIAGAGLQREMADPALANPIPEHLRAWWSQDLWCLHSAAWWRRHWGRTGILNIAVADTMPDGWKYWLEWLRAVAPENLSEIQAFEADRGDWLGYVRAIGHRRGEVKLDEPITSIPASYERKPLLRNPA